MKQRLSIALSATALVVAVLGATPLGEAAQRTLQLHKATQKSAWSSWHVCNSDSGFIRVPAESRTEEAGVRCKNLIRASRTPKPRQLFPLGRNGKFPASVLPSIAGPRGPAGPPGPAGAPGATGLQGPKGDIGPSNVIVRRDAGPDTLPPHAFGGVVVVTMANVPAGSWLLLGKSDAVNPTTAASIFRCRIFVGETELAAASGQIHSSVLVMPLMMMAAVNSDTPFTASLRCHHDQAVPNSYMEQSQLVAIRTGGVDVAPG